MSDADDKDPDEQTHLGGAPAAPKLPTAPPPPAPPPTAAEPPPDDAGAPAAADDESTQFIDRGSDWPNVTLNRLAPPGHAGSVALRGTAYVLGRAPTCDIRLYSPTASREHARLTARAGAWYLTPCEDKKVLANGAEVHGEIRLEHQMRLQLGRDELLVLDPLAVQGAPPAAAGSAVSEAGTSRGRSRWWIVAAAIAALALLVIVAWLRWGT